MERKNFCMKFTISLTKFKIYYCNRVVSPEANVGQGSEGDSLQKHFGQFFHFPVFYCIALFSMKGNLFQIIATPEKSPKPKKSHSVMNKLV